MANPADSSYPLSPRDRKIVGLIGLTEILIGLVYTMLGSVLLPLCLITGRCGRSMYVTGYAIWSGIAFTITGAYGWECYKTPKRSSQVVSLLVWSVISAVLCGICFSLAVIDCQHYVLEYYMDTDLVVETSENKAKRAFSIIFAILGIVEAGLAIANSSICCRVYGCCQDSTETV